MTNNVSDHEIGKFDAMAKQWWDPDGPMKPLHQLNPLRLSYINQHANVTNKRILDVGCGGGILSEAMAASGGLVTGIDMSDDALTAATTHAAAHDINLTYTASTAEAYAERHPGQFDIVTCLEMLEHVPNPTAVVNACVSLTRPGGHVFFSTINRTAKAFLLAIVGAEYVLNLLPKGTHEYEKFIRPSELNLAAEAAHLELINLQGIHYNPLSQTFSLSRKVDVNYIACYKKA